MGKSQKTSNQAASGIRSVNSGKDAYIQKYYETVYNGGTAAEATQAARNAAMPNFDETVAQHSANTSAAQKLQSGEYYRNENGRIINKSAEETYAQRVMAAQAQNSWAESGKGVYSPDNSSDAYRQSVYDEAEKRAAQIEEGNDKLGWLSGVGNTIAAWINQRTGSSLRTFGTMNTVGSQTDINRKPTSIAGVTVSNVNLSDDQVKTIEEAKQKQAVYGQALTQEGDIQASTSAQLLQDVKYGKDKYGAGNIDLTKRPLVENEDGTVSTVYSMSFEEDGKEILIPTVIPVNGQWMIVDNQTAIDYYHQTGEYLGKFDTIAEANEYANAIHEQQQKMIEGKATSTGAAVRGFLSQAATSYADVIADAGVNMLTGGAGLLAMSTRAGINEAANARLEGKDQVTQLKTGLKSGIIEYITEVAGGALDFAYGPSFLSDITDKVIAKVTSKYGTRIALRLASSGVEEALEEIMSGILNPMADRILKLDDGTGSWVKNIDWEETLYEGLIGGTIGLLGAGVNGDTYAKESVYDPYGEGAQDIIDAAKQSSSFRARKMADKYSADTLTNKQADRLMNAGNTADIYANTVMQRAQEAQQAQNQALTVQDNAQKRQNAVNQFMGQNGMQQTSSSVQTEGVEVNTPSGGKAIFSGLAVQNGEIVAKLTNADGSVTYDSRENVEQALPADTTAFIENVVTAFGENAAAVYAMYDPAQNANDYIAGMSEAINLYAANGVNPKQAAQNARAQAAQETGDENSSASLVATLNDTQLDYANSVGQEMYDAKVDAAQQKTQEYTAAMEALDDANGMERRAEGSAVETQRRQNIADRIDAAYAAGVAEYNDWRGQYDSTVQQMNRYTPGSAEYNSLLQQANTIAEESDKLAGELTNLKEQREQARANLKEAQQKEAAAKKARDERKAQREAYNKKRNGKKGSISFDGGNVNGTTYNAVDFNKLNRTQKKSVKIIEQLTDAVSVDFVLFDGDAKGDQGVYLSGGKIYVNVNAGMAIEKVLALFTVSHEMTHMLSEMAPEDFLAITKFIIEHDGQGVFDKRVRQIMATQGLDYDAAVEEYVCQACTRMIENSKAIEELFRQNMSLGERIVEFLKEIIANIKAVFAEADGFNFAEAKAVEAYTDELQALWDSALYNAEYNLQAMRETEYIRRAQQSMQGDENGTSEMDAEDPAKMQKWELMTEEEQNVEIAKNKAFNDSKTVTGSNLKTLRGSDLKRGGTLKGHKYPLGKIVGDQLYFEKSYVDQIAAADSTFKELYTEAVKKLHEAYPDFNFKGVMYETKTGKIAFQESPDFDTAREPITGRQVNVPMGGDAEMAKGGKPYMQIWHHKWMWVDNNYSGFDVDKAWQWSKQFASTIIGVPNGAHMEAWNKQLDSFGLPHDDVKFQKWEETDTVEQKATSADTSLNQLPSLFTNKYAEFVPFGVNIDIGGGKYDKASEYLQGLGVENKVFDPYNRSEEVNTETLNWLMRGNKADTASCANVLNVISSPEARANVILEMAKAIKPDGAAYFVVYEGDGTGNSRDTTKGWQEHRKTDTYVPEIEAYFDDVQRKGKLIIAKNPKANLPAAAWEVTAGKGVKFQKWAQYEWYNDKTRENESRESQMITEEDRAYFRDLISERMNSHIKPGMTEEEIYAQKIKNLQDYIREYGDSLTYEQEQDINEQITALYYHKDPYDEFDSFELSRIEEFEKNAKFQKWDDEHKDLVAVHNKSVSGLERMLKRGGVPFPSIAIKKAGTNHEGFGDISIVFPRSSIDPQVNRQNRIYSNDAWTPTEPRIEYEASKAYEYAKTLKKEIGDEAYNGLRGYGRMEQEEIEKALQYAKGDIYEALQDNKLIRYAFLNEKGNAPVPSMIESSLDSFGKYGNDLLLPVFDAINEEELLNATYDSDMRERVAEAMNDYTSKKYGYDRRKGDLFNPDNINLNIIKDALQKYINNGRQVAFEKNWFDVDNALGLMDMSKYSDYKGWIENRYGNIITNSGIRNGRDLFTPSGNRRSFNQLHVSATMENIISAMQKQEETGNGVGDINLRGAATKSYRTVDEARKDSGKLIGTHIADEMYDSYMKGFFNRLHDLSERAIKIKRDSYYNTEENILLEAVRDCNSLESMDRFLKKEAQWINYSRELSEDLWQLKIDVQNMPAPYFEAKPRRFVQLEEALAFIVPDSIDQNILDEMNRRNLPVMQYESGNEDDRLEKLNSVEGAKFQKWDDMSYEELKAEKEKLYEEMNDVRENNNILKMTSGYSQLMVQFEENNRKIRNGIRNGLSKEEIKTLHDENKVLKEKIDALRAEYRIDTVANKERQTEQIYKELLAAMENAWIRESNERENKRIEESGLSPEDYFREKSLEFVGTTNDFNEAGYLLPDGRMLDFSGKKEGGTPGRRSYDHRDIAGIYEATYGSEAMYRFEADGNIRMMPEGPGIEINAFREPTAEQYEKIREFVRELGEQEGQFYTDITDPQSERNSKSLFYPGSPRADLVVNEIKSFFRTGTVREQNTLRAFYQKWDAAMNDWNVNLSSKLESVLDDPKLPNRMMAEQVEKILLGKMVTPEEFKWSGIPEFLEGKTKVTKDELKQVVQANRIEIKTEILDDSAYEQELEKFKNQTVFVDDETGHSFLESGILTQAAYSAGIPEYNTAGLHIEYTNTIEPDVFRFAVVDQNNKTLLTGEASLPDPRNPGPTWIQNTNFRSWTLDGPFTKYREILFSFPDSNFTTKMGKMHWGSDRKGIFAHARIDERIDKEYQRLLFIEEIQSDWHNAGKKSKLKFVTKDANRYRELVKERYSRELSEDENAEMMSLQKKVNPSRAEQFSALKEFNRIKEEAAEALSISLPKRGLAYDRYNAMDWIKGAAPSPWSYLEQDPYNPGSIEEGDQVFNSLTKEEQDLIVETRNIYKKYQDFQYSSDEFEIELKKSAPDAPYAGAKDSYVPFVMKNLLQMAAQQGYDGIAWTTAEQQDERWADGEYHEPGKGLSGNLGAYTIEYDQNMKKFMDTFGKKYGTKTEQTVIDIGNGNNGTAWVFYLWDDMKENIIAGEGMTKFQKWNPDELSMDEWAKQYDMGEMKLRPDFRQNIQDFSDAEYAVKNFFRKHFGDTENWPEDEELFDYWMQFDFEDGVSLSAMEVAEYIYPMLENLWGNDLEEAYDVIDRLAEISMPRDTFFLYDERFMKDKFGENLEILKKMRRYRDRYNELNPGEIVDLGTVGMMSNTSKLMYRVRGTYGDAEYTYDEIYRQMQWKAIREGKLIMDYRLRRSGEGELGGDLYMQDPATGEIVFRAEPVREIKKNSRKAGQMAMFQKWEQESMQDDTNEESRARATANVTQQTGKRLAQEMIADLNRELKQARKDAEAAGVTIEQLRRELKLTDKPEVREKDARKLANKLAKEYGSKVDRAEIANMIKELGDYIVQSTADSIDYVVLEKSTKKIAEKVLGSVETVSEEEAAKLDYVQQIASRIKGSKFTLAEQDRGELDGGYNEFRKRNFGRFTLGEGGSAVDSFYKELQSEFGVTNYLPELNNPGEMLQQFELIFNEAKPELVNPFADYWTEAVNSTANDILYDVIGDTLRQMPPTFADKAQAKLDRQKAKDREKLDAVKEELRDTRREKTRLEKKLEKAEARYQNLKETKDKRIQEIIRNGKARRAEAIAKEKAEKWKKVKAVRDFYREKAKREHENRKENAAVKKLRNKVIEKAGRLYKWLTENSGKHHIPESLKKPVSELLLEIDFTSKRSLNGGDETASDRSFAARMNELRDILQRQMNAQNGVEDAQNVFNGYMDLPLGVLDQMADIVKAANVVAESGGTFTVNEMNSEQLGTLNDILDVMTAAVKQINALHASNLYAGVDEAGRETIDEMKAKKPLSEKLMMKNGKKPAAAVANDFMLWENMVPVYAFGRYGKAGRNMFDGLRRGWGTFARDTQQLIEFTKQVYTAEEVQQWRNEKKTVGMVNQKGEFVDVKMSVPEIMGLYELMKRGQALQHMLAGGIQVPSSSVDHNAVDVQILNNITSLLTDRQRAVADALQTYMQKTGGEWGNEVTMKRWGIRQFGEEHYYPIETDSSDRNADASLDAQGNKKLSLYRIMNMGFTKGLNKHANNAIVIRDIFDVFANHMSDMAKYHGLTLPMLDILKWYNYREKVDVENSDSGQYTTESVQRAIEKVYGRAANNYFMQFMKDVNGVNDGGTTLEGIAKAAMGAYKVAQIGFNLRVVIQQPTSIARAMVLMDPKWLARGVVTKGDFDEMMEHSGLAVWKIGLGFYDVNTNAGIRKKIANDMTRREDIQEKSTWLAGKADEVTWTAIWRACKAEAIAKGVPDEILMDVVTERFENLILETQVMDSTITRSQIMRSKSLFVNEYTGFMSEPTLTYNVLLDSYLKFRDMWSKTDFQTAWKQQGANVMKTLNVFAISAALTAAAESIMDANRDDDDYETWLQKYRQHFLENFKDNMNPFQLVPVIADVWDMLEQLVTTGSYSSDSTMDKAGLTKLISSGKKLYQLITEGSAGNYTAYGVLYSTMQGLGMVLGLPIAPAVRELTSFYNGAATIYNDILGNRINEPLPHLKTYDRGDKQNIRDAYDNGYLTEEEAQQKLVETGEAETAEDAMKQTYKWETGSTNMYEPLYNAVKSGDGETVNLIRERMASMGYTENEINGKIKQKISEWYTDTKVSMDRATAVDALVLYAGMTRTDAEARCAYDWFYNEHPEANVDGKSSVTQDELGQTLREMERNGQLTRSEAEQLWLGRTAGDTNPWKKTYSEWVSKNK